MGRRKFIIRIKEDKLYTLNKVISAISPEKEKRMRKNCLKIYDYFKNNFNNNQKTKIVHYCCGSYFTGHIGGVGLDMNIKYQRLLQEYFILDHSRKMIC